MANLRIGYLNRADLATLTADPVMSASGPVTYLQSDARGDICQATSTASQDIKLTWGGDAYTISKLTLWRHNLAYSDTIRLYLYSTTDWTGAPLYDSTALAAYASTLFDDWGWGYTNRYFTAVAGVKSAIIRVAASAAAFECARLFLGPYTEAPINPQENAMFNEETNAKQNRSESGSLRTIAKAQWRGVSFDMLLQTEADRAIWREISRYCGLDKSFVASLYPGVGGAQERDHTVFGKFDGRSPGMKIGINRFDFSMKISEL